MFELMMKYWFCTLVLGIVAIGIELRLEQRSERKKMERRVKGFTRDREW
jgi:hypothetical protein